MTSRENKTAPSAESAGPAAQYRFTRTRLLRNAGQAQKATQLALQIQTYMQEKYDVHLSVAFELFGQPRAHFQYRAESLDQIAQLSQQLIEDTAYQTLLEKSQEVWTGTTEDCVTRIISPQP